MYYLKFIYWYWKLFSIRDTFILYKGNSSFQALTIKYQPQIYFLGMFSNGKFMAGYNVKKNLPWNSPYFLADFYILNQKRALFLGGGPCCAPNALWRRDKSIWIDIVERDPLTIALAYKYFGLSREKHISILNQNAEEFVQKTRQSYDVIFFDVGFSYDRKRDRDYQFCQSSITLRKLKMLINSRGIIIYVVIANRTKKQRFFLKGLINKFRLHFHTIDIYCDYPQSNNKTQSHIFVLTNNKLLQPFRIKKLINLNNQWGDMYRELWLKKLLLSNII